jgi:hypothetical protein
MAKDDEAARKARAESLLQEINRLTSPQSATEKEESEAANKEETSVQKDDREETTSESPREFIHRRMRELDKLDQGKKP